MRLLRLLRLSVFAVAALAPVVGFAQSTTAGTVTLLNGQALATGVTKPVHSLSKGDSVYGGDVVETGAASYAMIRFTDEGSVLLRPNTRFQIEKYQYQGSPQAAQQAAAPAQRQALAPLQTAGASAPDSSFFRLLKGGLRAVSGLIAHADYKHYGMSTPVATMGIRGTDYELVLCEDSCVTDETVLKSLPPGANPAGGVVSGVNEGQIVVTSYTGSSVTLNAGQFAITLANGSQYLLSGLPAFLSSASAAATEGAAAGGSAAASAAAGGSVLAGVGLAAGAAALVGVVVSSSGNNGSSSTTTTSTAHP